MRVFDETACCARVCVAVRYEAEGRGLRGIAGEGGEGLLSGAHSTS